MGLISLRARVNIKRLVTVIYAPYSVLSSTQPQSARTADTIGHLQPASASRLIGNSDWILIGINPQLQNANAEQKQTRP